MTIGRACVLVITEQRERETRKKCAGRERECGSVAGGRWRLSSEDPVDAAAARDECNERGRCLAISNTLKWAVSLSAVCFFLLAQAPARQQYERPSLGIHGNTELSFLLRYYGDAPIAPSRIRSPPSGRVISRGPRRDPKIVESASGARSITLVR